jgi:REP element-mobilizing transposase RayT
MSEKYKGKYRRESARAAWWDYGDDGAYFITICTDNRIYYFGDIVQGEMHLSEIGKMAVHFWHELPDHFQNIKLDNFIVMPDHVHGIIILEKQDHDNSKFGDDATGHDVATGHALSLPCPPDHHYRFRNQGKNTISAMVGSYKSALTRWCNKNGYSFAWQRKFHDHIIRNDLELNRIRSYIAKNPENWDKEK